MRKTLRQVGDLVTGRVHSLGLFLTRRCNSRCVYCCLEVGTDPKDKLTLEEIKRVLKEASDMGARQLVIPGEGEPLLDENLFPVIEHAQALGMTTKVYTNGALVTPAAAARLFRSGVSVVFKLPTLDEAVYDRLAGVPRLLRWAAAPSKANPDGRTRVPEALLHFLDAGYGTPRGRLLFSVECAVMKPNLADIPAVARLCRRLGLEFLPETTIRLAAADRSWDALAVTPGEEAALFRELVRISGRRFLWQQRVRCRFETNPFIDASGNLRHCFGLAADIGNIREAPLAELHAREMKLRRETGMLNPKIAPRHRGFRKCATRRSLESRGND